jgi:hypothetical protein
VKSIFVAKIDSKYDDDIAVKYHFPKRYLKCAKETIGDGVIFYQSRRDGGQLAYFAFGTVSEIVPDPVQADHFYAKYPTILTLIGQSIFASAEAWSLRSSGPTVRSMPGQRKTLFATFLSWSFRPSWRQDWTNSQTGRIAISPFPALKKNRRHSRGQLSSQV